MKSYDILIVDDDPDIMEIMSLYLNNAGFRVYKAGNGAEALVQIRERTFHLIILDIMLPDNDGTELCEQIRRFVFCPILFVSCMDDEEHILRALRVGGDDYIRKPFYPKELVARVETNLRRVELDRTPAAGAAHTLFVRDLVIDVKKAAVYTSRQEVPLSPIEFNILMLMVKRPREILSYADIYEHVWHSSSIGDTRTVMVHVSNLRKKLDERNPGKYIKTVKKQGYIFSDI